MAGDVATIQAPADLLERVIVKGDLSALTSEERLRYYKMVCDSVGLNPLTRPLSYLTLNNKLTLYANKDATDQLRKKHDVSIERLEDKVVHGVYCVTAYAKNEKGRTDSSIGAVSLERLQGEALANAMMKAETKAKRRVTLSICGLGMLDETEVDTIPDAVKGEPPSLPRLTVDQGTGEVVEQNEKDRGRLLEQIAVDSKFLGLMRSEYKRNWQNYCGGAREEDALISHLMGLADFLAGEVTKRKASGAQESVPF